LTDLKQHSPDANSKFDILAIGGSAGSFPAMIEWIKHNQGPSIVLVIHRSKDHKSNLIQLLQYYTDFIVKEPIDKEKLQKKHIYIAPAGNHIELDEDQKWRLLDSPPVWHCKPAIDVLFSSLSHNTATRTAAVLLSGANADGGIGLKEIKDAGGFTLCMNPEEAEYANMPNAAKKQDAVTRYFGIDEIKGLCERYF